MDDNIKQYICKFFYIIITNLQIITNTNARKKTAFHDSFNMRAGDQKSKPQEWLTMAV